MGFSIVYKKLIFKGIKIEFRIRCIMLILEKLNTNLIYRRQNKDSQVLWLYRLLYDNLIVSFI